MKGITMIKRSLVKTLKQNGYTEWNCENSFPPLNVQKVFYNEKYKFGIDRNEYETEFFKVQYWKIAEQCIKYVCGKDYVLKMLKRK